MKRLTSSIAMLVLLAIPLFLASCGGTGGGSTGGASTVTLQLYAGGDENIRNIWNVLITEYKKTHPGIDVRMTFEGQNVDPQVTFARLSAAAQQGKDPGIDLLASNILGQMEQAKLLIPLTDKEIPLISHIDPQRLKLENGMAVPWRASSVVLAYNSQEVQQPPTTIQGVLDWIKAHPGKFAHCAPVDCGSGTAFVEAVLLSHAPADQQQGFIDDNTYSASQENAWKPGLDTLKALNPDMYNHGFYPNSNQAVLTLLANDSISMAPVWSDQGLAALSTHQLPDYIKLLQLTPPFFGGTGSIGVPKTTPHPKEAEEFVNWVLDTTAQTDVVNILHGYPGIDWTYMPDDVRQRFASIAHAYSAGFSSKFEKDLDIQWQAQIAAGS